MRQYSKPEFDRFVLISEGTKIGDHVKIGAFVTIGEDGFGFERNGEGYTMPPKRREHPYGVVIHDRVEIGSQTRIHRGRHRDTVIGYATMLDSGVHVAHNVIIGKCCFVVSGTTIGGSCEIGDECFIGENVCIKQGIKIANNVTIGMGSVVRHDITQSNSTWAGNPCVKIADVQKF